VYLIERYFLYRQHRAALLPKCLQRHKQRSEHWYAVSGEGRAIIAGRNHQMTAGTAVDIPQGATHRLENLSNVDLVIIEVQTGTYFGEDDIERLEDKYGRV
jgi:mannose-6-phosphate isomerase-like protein (cupin superfamily)